MILICLILIAIFIISGYMAYNKAEKFQQRPKSRPCYYGILSGLLSLITAIGMWLVLEILCYFYEGFRLHSTIAIIFFLVFGSLGGGISQSLVVPTFDARTCFEKIIRIVLASMAILSVLITLSIIFTLLFETIRFFKQIPVMDFLFGLHWNPQTSYTSDTQIIDHGLYGAIPLFTGTFLIMAIALLIAAPMGLLIAIYMREYARSRTRYLIKPMIEILAGIPTIVYGFFALVAVMPFLQSLGDWIGIDISSQSALGVGIVMGLMIIPYISSLSDDALSTVPQSLRDNSLALGATTSETIKKVVIPAAAPGIITAILLGVSRAIGETMLVVMAAGLTPNLTLNPAEAVTTVTVQIVSLLTGDQEFNSPKTLSAFALGLTLFLLTLVLNIISGRIIKRHRDKYDV
ncbi:MAG: phosphate ABC transporter permease subunit PstC [Janthinobacterium lividum]